MKRDATTSRIVPDPTKFPKGISDVADQIHALGLKMGIYGQAHPLLPDAIIDTIIIVTLGQRPVLASLGL